jgi:hypothetical protein
VVSPLLPESGYLPLLLQVRPRLVYPAGSGDYFAGEQVATWGVDDFWGLPHYPRTPYYRLDIDGIDLPDAARLFEFVVPVVPPSWNDVHRVAEHAAQLRHGPVPVCLALSTLDICQPAVTRPGTTEPNTTHWGLTHFLLDGHHRMHAAAQAQRPLRLFSMLCVDHSLATTDQIKAVPGALAT